MPPPTVANLVEAACLLEARARKPGNVHPGASFVDTTFDDFAKSARCINPVFEQASRLDVGELVLNAVQATHHALGKNTNLGIILVLAPLAKAKEPTQASVSAVLAALTRKDAELVYEAIRLARPGGLGESPEEDVCDPPSVTLLEAMRLAADRDLVARQYANTFHDVFRMHLPGLEAGFASDSPLEFTVVHTYVVSLALLGDTLILRKCGRAVADEAQRRAEAVLDLNWPHTPASVDAFHALDQWLRGDGHRRNPGATADLIAAALFLALRRGSIEFPLNRPWEFRTFSR